MISKEELLEKEKQIRRENWEIQSQAGLNLLPLGDIAVKNYINTNFDFIALDYIVFLWYC
ncbi:MAG: hypothetical protein HYX60_04910 [Legionella longbeachae]|nr:hypothetical protein [Legionella longbeachae]